MIAARILFVLSLLGLIGAANALWRPNHDRSWVFRPWWLFAVLTGELVPLRIAIHGLLVVVLAAFGALDHRAGRIGLWLTAFTWAGYGWLQWRARRTRHVMNAALDRAGIPASPGARAPWGRILAGYPYRVPSGVQRVEDIEYAPGLHLDLYRSQAPEPRPVLVQIHGGSWRGGNRRQQARPLLHGLAHRGWVTAALSYPLVPQVSAEGQLVALKRAIAWLRTSGPDHGIDPRFVAVTGGSAGAHLAALVALTSNQAEYQPGFEDIDTSIQAAVSLYGVYDLLNRNRTRDDWPMVRALMRARPREAEDRYRAASPLDQVGPHAPPFLVIHGSNDSLISPREAEFFVAALRSTSEARVAYAEIPGANHAFDLVYSLRSHHVVNAVERFLTHTLREHESPGTVLEEEPPARTAP